ncbi:hypothetical protein HNP48_001605 [Acidovorax soli]|uniref:Uncharacterized protein n=1 Tax=Acidovorax soli TaxID=592050 RepID=A0A7X0PBS4_9BURK|nr:hypothetical protein [Acidovorax soli]MBB6558941.1 hypothetical protein [Acidovorax soli]
MRRLLAICVLLLGCVFLTQVVAASVSAYDHCCIADCGDGGASCTMPGCQPCGMPLMAASRARLSDVPQKSGPPVDAGQPWASWSTSVWIPPD